MIPIKSEQELEVMRQAGRIIAGIAAKLRESVKQGTTTGRISDLALKYMEAEGVVSAFKNYRGYPGNICISVNEEIVHGIPKDRQLAEGDIVSIDLGIKYNGYFSDMAFTVGVGSISSRAKKLIDVARKSLVFGIKQAKADNRLSDISYAIQHYVENNGFSVVRQFVGHGIGRDLHEEPEIPNFGAPNQKEVLRPGMVLAIEPMVNMGNWDCRVLKDGWTAVTADGLPSAHFEHTVAITEKGAEILTSV
ncbi:MAG: type I methionyl aminopeptidase [Candidatus Omnitrophota bacterium]|nr:type I methionyl aminopeptidase [Candidatus Omnitrophota bacterium]MBU1928759.1 type I methionyl aminopeptidase [Candidatus Omnitrophota bacterium]MBU2034214.1 type I methionyl aminopeptidase [Candidatus Omnitrophota bacterium]MBU2221567.1 type I methionyl aminopeptidase [Candidatus Omnitrophota bacterium]